MKLTRTQRLFKDPQAGSLMLLLMIFGIAVGLFSGTLNNFLHEVHHIDQEGRGWIELPREFPGLILFLLLALLHRFQEQAIFRIALLTSATGLLGLSLFGTSLPGAVFFIILMSSGEHLLMPIRDSMAIHMSLPGKEGLAMGGIRSFMHLGQVGGYYFAALLFPILGIFFKGDIPFFINYGIGFALLTTAVILSLRLPREEARPPRQKLRIQKKYTRYYILETLFGARKQVFLTFAPFVLILEYNASTEVIALLYGLWSLGNIFFAPLVGRITDKIGYKKILQIDAVILTLVCLGYGFAPRLFPFRTAYIVTTILFIVDAMLFAVGIARSMYVKSKAASKEEITVTLSTGISINHFVSIIIAITGGILWKALGLEALFSLAALLGVGSFIYSTLLETPEKKA